MHAHTNIMAAENSSKSNTLDFCLWLAAKLLGGLESTA